MRWRLAFAAAGAVITALLLSGCTQREGGMVGLTKNSRGDLVGVVQMCEGSVDGAILYDFTRENAKDLARIKFARDVSGYHSFVLGNEKSLASKMTAKGNYSMYAGGSSWSTLDVEFTLKDVARIEQGRVLAPILNGSSYHVGSLTLAEFRGQACSVRWG